MCVSAGHVSVTGFPFCVDQMVGGIQLKPSSGTLA